jgi:hypothetical protein
MTFIKHFIKIHSVYKFANRFTLVDCFDSAVNLVIKNHIKSEIIGSWLYCFTSSLIGCQLEAIGFWYSFKHHAYIYSGCPKDYIVFDETLDEIRERLGNQLIN